MRRIALISGLLATAGLLAVLIFGASAQGSSTAQFDVIFDDARGLISGQVVKVAGAKAGEIQNVVVTPDFKAKIEGTIDSKFMPFHRDATCTIRPEGLIAENYVDCDPGTPGSPPLKGTGGQPPTVPVDHTTEPVSLLDLFNIFNLPTRERFQVIIDELGVGTAGRGADFNAILRRANPALALARQAIGILARQKAQLATIVDATNTIAAEGAGHTQALQTFLDRAAALSTLTAAHRDPLSQTINKLPGLLDAMQPALQQVDTVARDGTPLLVQIHTAVPSLNRLSLDLGPFVKAAKPGLAKLGQSIKTAIPAIRDATPLLTVVRSYLQRSLPSTLLFAKLASNLQQHGFVENFLNVAYEIGASLAREDATSHLLSILLVGPESGACSNFATKPVAGCVAHYGSQPAYAPANSIAHRAAGGTSGTPVARTSTNSPSGSTSPATGAPAAGTTATGSTAAGSAAAPPAAGGLPAVAGAAVAQTGQALKSLMGYLLK
jgi:phospholipid/cholesterol/gamma-HCH transport system substrate-binding protein